MPRATSAELKIFHMQVNKMSDKKHLLFVYGTLLQGHSNHRVIEKAQFIDAAVTDPLFTMYSNGYYPAITEEPKYQIVGEVYALDDETFRDTDYLEGYDPKNPERGLYNRKLITVTLKSNEKAQVWVYFQKNAGPQNRMFELTIGDFHKVHTEGYNDHVVKTR